MQKKKASKLLEVNHAVESYLDNLLQEATQATLKQNISEKPKTKDVSNLAKLHVIDTPLTSLSETKKPLVEAQTIQQQLQWPLQCLMFKVNNNILSIPLIKMGNVIPWGGRLTHLPKSPQHVKGILKHQQYNIKVVDTATFLGEVSTDEEFSPSHILVLDDYEWAITCDQLLDVVAIEENDIKWHEPTMNKMSFGVIKNSLAQLLNPTVMSKQLLSGSRNSNLGE